MALLLAVATPFATHAQLKVMTNGHVVVREKTPQQPLPGGMTLDTSLKPDTLAALTIDGNDSYTHAGGRISFGHAGGVSISESTDDVLDLHASKGISYWESSSNSPVFFHKATPATMLAGTNPFTFNCYVQAQSYLTVSDERLKQDIRPISGYGDFLDLLTPVRYTLKDACVSFGADAKEETSASLRSNDDPTPQVASDQTPGGSQYGFLAQEVQQCYPELVRETEGGLLAVDYQGFIPILVDEICRLRQSSREQELQIASLTEQLAALNADKPIQTSDERTWMGRCHPNPVQSVAELELAVDSEAGDAWIEVTSSEGHPVLSMPVNERGRSMVALDLSGLSAGIYTCTLKTKEGEQYSQRLIKQ